MAATSLLVVLGVDATSRGKAVRLVALHTAGLAAPIGRGGKHDVGRCTP